MSDFTEERICELRKTIAGDVRAQLAEEERRGREAAQFVEKEYHSIASDFIAFAHAIIALPVYGVARLVIGQYLAFKTAIEYALKHASN